jgi:hypothetical protein
MIIEFASEPNSDPDAGAADLYWSRYVDELMPTPGRTEVERGLTFGQQLRPVARSNVELSSC